MRNTDYSVIEEPNKVYILGSKGVGKTSFIWKLFNFSFDEKIASTEIGIQTSRLNMENKFFTIKELTDNDDFKCTPIFKNDIEEILIIFIIFSLTDKESCEYMKRLIEIIGHSIIDNIGLEIIICGNKFDIVQKNKGKRMVDTNEMEKYALNIRNCKYFEISCKTNENIDHIMNILKEYEIPQLDEEKIELEEEKENLQKNGASCKII